MSNYLGIFQIYRIERDNMIQDCQKFIQYKVINCGDHFCARPRGAVVTKAVFVLGENHFWKYFFVFTGVWLCMENAFSGNGFQLTMCWV